MRFKLISNAYINMPFHHPDDPVGVIRTAPQFFKAEPSAPYILDLPDDFDINNLSRKWEPLDDAARLAQAKLKNATVKPLAASLDPSGMIDALSKMTSEDRAAIMASITNKERATKAAEAEAAKSEGTMSGINAKRAALSTPKG